MTGPHAPVHLSGELSLVVDGVDARVQARGAHLRVVTADVPAFVARVREAAIAVGGAAPTRRDVGDLAEALAAAGVTAHLESTTRPVAAVGAGVDSAAGALLMGSRRIRPRAAAVVLAARPARRLLAAGAVAVALVGLLARRRG
jgi:hypothetical protein